MEYIELKTGSEELLKLEREAIIYMTKWFTLAEYEHSGKSVIPNPVVNRMSKNEFMRKLELIVFNYGTSNEIEDLRNGNIYKVDKDVMNNIQTQIYKNLVNLYF